MTTDTPTTTSTTPRPRRSPLPRWAQWLVALVAEGACLAVLIKFYQAGPHPLLLLPGAVVGSLVGVAAQRRRRRRRAHPPSPPATGTGTVTGGVVGRRVGWGWQWAGGVLAGIGVWVGAGAVQLAERVVQERARVCDGGLAVPGWVLGCSWVALVAAVAGVGLTLARWLRWRDAVASLACAAGLAAGLAGVLAGAGLLWVPGVGVLAGVVILRAGRVVGLRPGLVSALLGVGLCLFCLAAVYSDIDPTPYPCSGHAVVSRR